MTDKEQIEKLKGALRACYLALSHDMLFNIGPYDRDALDKAHDCLKDEPWLNCESEVKP